jgi:hypothetical protein
VVKLQERKMKKQYKRKEYTCKKYLLEFPVKANKKIEPHKNKNFNDIEITSKDTPTKEFINIQLVRNKTSEELAKKTD